MAAVNSFTSVVQGVPKQALEWEMEDFNAKEFDLRSEGALTKTRLNVMFRRNSMDQNNAETARGTQRGGWAGVRADRMRNDRDYNAGNIDRLMRRQLGQLKRNRALATLGYTL